jgi:hypothetical protein
LLAPKPYSLRLSGKLFFFVQVAALGMLGSLGACGGGSSATGGGGSGAPATITEIQHPATGPTTCGTFGGTTTTTCTLQVTATGAGHFGIVTIAVLSQSTTPTHITSITDNMGGTWIQPSITSGSGCYFTSVGESVGTVACAYNLTLAAGVTSITVNWDIFTNEGARLDFREYSFNGASVEFDAAGQFENLGTVTAPFAWASPSGLTGTNDVIVQVISPCCGTPTGISAPYGNLNATSFYGSADLLNSVSTTAPTSGSTDPGAFVIGWIAIKELPTQPTQ